MLVTDELVQQMKVSGLDELVLLVCAAGTMIDERLVPGSVSILNDEGIAIAVKAHASLCLSRLESILGGSTALKSLQELNRKCDSFLSAP